MIINATFARNQSNINMLIDKIEELLKEVSQLSANNADEVEQLRLMYLSKKAK